MPNDKTAFIPEIRFKGFTDAWVQRKLGDMVESFDKVVSGKSSLPIATSSRKGLFLQDKYFDGGRTGIDENVNFHLMPKGYITYRHMSDDSIFKFNQNDFDCDVLVSKEYPIFRSNMFSDQYYLLTHLNNSPRFLEFSTMQKLGSTRVRLYFKVLKEYRLNTPALSEQSSIGSFFRTFDDAITLHKRKLEGLKKLKSGYLQVMFPQNEESVPMVRFQGFSGDWEETTLGGISNIKTGESDVQDAVSDGGYPFFVRSQKIERSNKYLFDGEAILIPGEGRLGDIYHYINGKFDYHQRVYKISDFYGNVSGVFILYTMQKTFKRHAMTYTVKATVDSLRLPMLTGFKLLLPTLPEQKVIGELFQNLDNRITAQSEKLEKLKQLKVAYLQKMFI